MQNPETASLARHELPAATEAAWHKFSNPEVAKNGFKQILQEIGEAE